MAQVYLQFPIIGCIDLNTGIILTINTYLHNMNNVLLDEFTIQDLDYNKDKSGE